MTVLWNRTRLGAEILSSRLLQGSRKEVVRAPSRENEEKGAYLKHNGDRVYMIVWE